MKPGKLRLSILIPMQPAGFPADEINHRASATYDLGDGWEVGAAVQKQIPPLWAPTGWRGRMTSGAGRSTSR